MKLHQTYHAFFLRLLLSAGILLVAGACAKEAEGELHTSEAASLELTLEVPEISTRALADFYDGLTPSDAWEAAVDGQILYRVTVFLTRFRVSAGTEQVIGWRDISLNSTLSGDGGYFVEETGQNGKPTQVKVVFDGKQVLPGHPGGEILKEGVYSIYAIANWSGIQLGDHNYAGKQDVATAIQTLQSALDGKYGLDTGHQAWTRFVNLKDRAVNTGQGTSASCICRKEPMPLTYSSTSLYLKPGSNHMSGSLVRTRARLRIEVQNESEQQQLRFSNLKFGRLTRTETWLFDKGAMTGQIASVPASSPQAIVSFPSGGEVVVPGIYDDNMQKNPKGTNSKVLFDGYILESRNADASGSAYWYAFDITHNNRGKKQIHEVMNRIDPGLDNALAPLTEIRRNQLLRIKVTARFNKAVGKLQFEVTQWDEKTGEIQFH